MANQVKELAKVLRKNCEEHNCHALGVGCPDCQAVAINEYLDSHPSSQSLKITEGYGEYVTKDGEPNPEAQLLANHIANKDLKETLEKTKDKDGHQILSRHTISLLRRDYEHAAKIEAMSKLSQLAADQPVVAELERKIAELEKQLEEANTYIQAHSEEVPRLKAQLQPVPDEKLEEKIDHILELYPNFIYDEVGHIPKWMETLDTTEAKSQLSALIKSREGKVAGEITLDRMFLRLEQIDHIMKDNPEIKFKVINQEARYSPPSSER